MNGRIRIAFGDNAYNFYVCETPYSGAFFAGETETKNYTSYRLTYYNVPVRSYLKESEYSDWPSVPARLLSLNGANRGT